MTSKTQKKPDDTAAKAADAVVDAGRKVLEDVVEAGSKTATNFFEQANNMNSENMQKTAEVYEEVTKFNQESMQAFNSMAGAVAEGIESYSQRVMDNFKAANKFSMHYLEKLSVAKSAQDLAAIQLETTTKIFEKSVTEAIDLNQAAADTISKSAAPLKKRAETVMAACMKGAA